MMKGLHAYYSIFFCLVWSTGSIPLYPFRFTLHLSYRSSYKRLGGLLCSVGNFIVADGLKRRLARKAEILMILCAHVSEAPYLEFQNPSYSFRRSLWKTKAAHSSHGGFKLDYKVLLNSVVDIRPSDKLGIHHGS